ncbi:L,D-transpeptidase family protein [Pseudocolwellia sp. HL-MZ19]|uniref:L,D-transpeptidase family protein n=1 Tax=unclassified Pseudocolwellia TaxID=2848178 RepID=UPI003CF2C196
MKKFKYLLLFLNACIYSLSFAGDIPTSSRAEKSIQNTEATLKKELAVKGLEYGSPIFIRIFKDPGILEVWLESDSGSFVNFKTYDICTFSGNLGPKLKEGDYQSPEGFYFVNASQLNPWSKFHLSFNLGYPNKYDREHGRTGSALMVHGDCVSIGCYAMTDNYMDEIYSLSVAALKEGQPFFRVHSFPFHLDTNTLDKHKSNQWYPFWKNLKEGFDHFNKYRKPPNVEVINGLYVFER